MAQPCQMTGIMLAVLVIAVCQTRGERERHKGSTTSIATTTITTTSIDGIGFRNKRLFIEYFCKAGEPSMELVKLRKCLKTNGTTIQVVKALYGQYPLWQCKGSTSSCYHDYTCNIARECDGKEECVFYADQLYPCGKKKPSFLRVKYSCIYHRSEQNGPCIRGQCYTTENDGLYVVKCQCRGTGFTGPTCGIVTTAPAVCAANEFTCKDGQCIQSDRTCDTEQDCTDGSDELNCADKFAAVRSTADGKLQSPAMLISVALGLCRLIHYIII